MYAFKDLLLLLQVLQAFSDALYASPGIFSAGTFARKSKNTYFYHFSHHSKVGPYGQVSDDYRCYFLRGIVSFCRKIPVFYQCYQPLHVYYCILTSEMFVFCQFLPFTSEAKVGNTGKILLEVLFFPCSLLANN